MLKSVNPFREYSIFVLFLVSETNERKEDGASSFPMRADFMRSRSSSVLSLVSVAVALVGVCPPALAAPGTVVVVAEGLPPQVLDLGRGYLRATDEDAMLSTAFDELKGKGQSAVVGDDALAQLGGILQTAHDNGYATGLVTTGDVTKVAPMFYTLPGDIAADLTAAEAPYEFLAGGGADKFEGEGAKMTDDGNTFVDSAERLDGVLTGKILVAESPGDLGYSIDRDPTQQSGFSELTTTALDVLTSGEKPFVLIVHDTLINKALQEHDTPALFEQFREMNTVLGDANAHRFDNPDLKIAALMTSAPVTVAPGAASPTEQNAIFLSIANLQKSFAGAGAGLKGKTVGEITDFADPDMGEYRGWTVSQADKEKIAAGTLDPEKAIRAFYEPTLKLTYAGTPSQPYGLVVGFEAPDGLVAALKTLVSTPAK